MKRLINTIFIATIISAITTSCAISYAKTKSQDLIKYPAEQEAIAACKDEDNIVWVNLRSKKYHTKESAFFGHTKVGAFACKNNAILNLYKKSKR